MSETNDIVHSMRETQRTIRRQMDKRGIHLKAVALDAELSYSTLLSYFPNAEGNAEPAILPATAIHRLTKALPVDLLSLLLPPGFLIVRVPEHVDHDDAAAAMRDFLSAKDQAHHPDSPGGREIAPSEDAELRGKLAVVGAGR